jgi:hypothetical protein
MSNLASFYPVLHGTAMLQSRDDGGVPPHPWSHGDYEQSVRVDVLESQCSADHSVPLLLLCRTEPTRMLVAPSRTDSAK